jgi:hypothetical protein
MTQGLHKVACLILSHKFIGGHTLSTYMDLYNTMFEVYRLVPAKRVLILEIDD